MYLNIENISNGQSSFYSFAPNLAKLTPRTKQQSHWQAVAQLGVELIERQDDIDAEDWDKSLSGKLVLTFAQMPNTGYGDPSVDESCGLARVIFSSQRVVCMHLYGIPRRTLELRVDETRFREQLSRYLDRPVGKIKLAPAPDWQGSYGDSLYLMVKTLRDLFAMGAHPVALKHQAGAILTALVQGPFHDHWHDCAEEAQPPSVMRMRAATAHIHAHLKDALTLNDLAQVAGCGVRSLQMAFDKHLGQSPLEYLRIQRLEAARNELSEGGRSVTEVAYDYGFSNPGRFAKTFQERFGKRPSDVLRKH